MSRLHRRGIAWVFRTAAIVGVLGIWLAVLAGVALDVRTSWQLARITSEAQHFATLPRVTRSELTAFVARRLQRDGFGDRAFSLVGAGGAWRIELL